jgi:hypothetical protein
MKEELRVIEFSPRFLSKSQMAEIIEFYHLAKVKHTSKHDRMILACKWFQDKYPEVKGAYKDLSGLVNWNWS